MPTDQRAIGAIAASLSTLIQELRKEDQPTGLITFPNSEWGLLSASNATIVYKRPETKAALDTFRKRFKRKAWTDAWSVMLLNDVEMSLLGDAYVANSEDEILEATNRAASKLDSTPPEHVVIIPIAHLHLGDLQLRLAGIEFRTVTENCLEEIRKSYYEIIDTSPRSIDQKDFFRTEVERSTDLLRNRACAFVKTLGDADRAYDNAILKLGNALDFFQLVAAVSEHSFKEIRIKAGGDLLADQPQPLIIATDGSAIRNKRRLRFGYRLEMKATHIPEMRAYGFGKLIDAINKNDEGRTEFERLMIRSMHWIADAERQELAENKTTSFTTAIDMFFSTKDEPVTRDVTEGTATILGENLEGRLHVLRDIQRVYSSRSKVSHAGDPIDSQDIVYLAKSIAINLLAKLSETSSDFTSRDSFREWLRKRRLSA